MDLAQELELLKKKEETLFNMIKSLETQQHRLESEMKTLQFMAGSENLEETIQSAMMNGSSSTTTQLATATSNITSTEATYMENASSYETNHQDHDFNQNDIDLQPSLAIARSHHAYEEEEEDEEEEEEDDDGNQDDVKKFTIL